MPKTRSRGFTLVELLIVVAVIGALSVIGVPTFRKMIHKSKQAEAKTMLAGLYRAEATFFAEYQFYGNNIAFMGLEGTPNYYTTGFPDQTCADGAPSPNPTLTDPLVQALVQKSPSYYDPANFRSRLLAKDTAVGHYCAGGMLVPPGTGSMGIALQCENGVMRNCVAPCYFGSAAGLVDPSLDRANVVQDRLDIWMIDSDRNLRNVCTGLASTSQQQQQQQN